MKEIIKQLDHLCSIKEYSSYGGMQILHDGSNLLYSIKVENLPENGIEVKLPLLMYHNVDPRQIFSEIQEELVRKYEAPSVYDEGFDEIIEQMLENNGSVEIFHPMYISMPNHPGQDFHEDCGYLCSIMFVDEDSMKFNLSQIDVNLYGSMPFNMLYTIMFAGILSNLTGRKLIECNFEYINPYLRREELPKVAQLIEEEPELDSCYIRIKKEISNLRNIEWNDIEVKIY